MHILIFNWRDSKHPLSGGAEITIYHHARYWQKKGAQITWFTSSFPGGKAEDTIDGIKIIRRGSHYTVQILGIWNYITGRLGHPDIIIDCFHFIPFYTPLFFDRKRILAVIHEVADKLWFKNISLPIAVVGYIIERFSFIFYKRIRFVTVSDSTKKELQNHGIHQRNITVIPNGSSNPLSLKNVQKEKHPTITFLGRLSPDKGIRDALLAFSMLDAGANVQLWIIGKEDRKGDLQQLIGKTVVNSELKKNIVYWGFVTEREKFALLKKSWILVHPSQKEGWGLTVIEAASQETPTIGYDVEGLKDSIIHDKTGLLVSPNPENLAESISFCLANEKKLASLSAEALKWSMKFDWEKAGKASWEIITQQYKNL
jgi:glycosyltransferase involved in cell wall biosynthesis